MSGIKPLHDNYLIKRNDSEEKTSGGIIIPDTAKEKPAEGVIIAVGNGKKDNSGNIIAPILKKGDKVLFEKWGATEIKSEGEDLLVIPESKIIGIFE